MRRLVAITFLTALFGCAADARLPVTGKLGGHPAYGYMLANLDAGDTRIVIDSIDGLSCRASVDTVQLAADGAIQAECNDGRTLSLQGKKLDGKHGGMGTGVLSDGTKVQFVYGQIRYADQFPGPDATAPYISAVDKNKAARKKPK